MGVSAHIYPTPITRLCTHHNRLKSSLTAQIQSFGLVILVATAMPMGGNKVADLASSSKKTRRRQKKPSASLSALPALSDSAMSRIQTVCDISRNVFVAATPGVLPPPPAEANLSEILNAMSLEDVGLDASMPYFRADSEGRPKVTYLHIADCPQFSFGVFCLPQSAVIPLHNHPGMTVFSKILLGSMHIKSYDWVKAHAMRTLDGARVAKLHTDAVFDASSTTVVLYPESRGNLHCFTATTPCAVLDVMGPPYCHIQGRDCSYYTVCPGPRGVTMPRGDGQYAWLKKVPCTFEMNAVYMPSNLRD